MGRAAHPFRTPRLSLAAALLPWIALPACAREGVVAAPPAVDVPAAPAQTARAPASQVAATSPPSPSASPAQDATPAQDAPPPWTEHVEVQAKTQRLSLCQVAPYTFASSITLEVRQVPPDRIAMRVVSDDESANGAAALPSLLGKGYVAGVAPAGGAQVLGTGGRALPDDEAARARALASTYVGWPGSKVAAALPAARAEVPALEAPVAALVNVPLHGGDITTQDEKATVTYRGAGPLVGDGSGSATLAFDVVVKATGDDAGMCHHWTHAATLAGTMVLRASSGTLLEMRLAGTTGDTEGLCMNPSGKPGPPPPAQACDKGTMRFTLSQERAP